MDDMALPDFTNKVLILYVRNAPRAIQDGIVLEYAKFEKRNGRLCVFRSKSATDSGGSRPPIAVQSGH
jgi:hypothetical protein